MKGLLKFALPLVAAIVMVSGLALAGDDSWFDMEHCSFCKTMLEDPELIHHMTWEQYPISDGIISLTTVDPAYTKSFETCTAKMEKLSQQLQQGKQMPLCNSCMAFGAIMMKGPKSEQIMTQHGEVWMVTSGDPEVVKELQNWAKKNMAELAKMHEQES